MVSTSVCGDGAKGRRGACRGVQVLELLAWRCEPESAPPRLRAYLPQWGGNSSDRAESRYTRINMRSCCAIEWDGVGKKKVFRFPDCGAGCYK